MKTSASGALASDALRKGTCDGSQTDRTGYPPLIDWIKATIDVTQRETDPDLTGAKTQTVMEQHHHHDDQDRHGRAPAQVGQRLSEAAQLSGTHRDGA